MLCPIPLLPCHLQTLQDVEVRQTDWPLGSVAPFCVARIPFVKGIFYTKRGRAENNSGVTPIITVVTPVTRHWSTVKASQKGVASFQIVLRYTIKGRSQCGTDGHVTTVNSSSLENVWLQ